MMMQRLETGWAFNGDWDILDCIYSLMVKDNGEAITDKVTAGFR
jgi:hypothetical protein